MKNVYCALVSKINYFLKIFFQFSPSVFKDASIDIWHDWNMKNLFWTLKRLKNPISIQNISIFQNIFPYSSSVCKDASNDIWHDGVNLIISIFLKLLRTDGRTEWHPGFWVPFWNFFLILKYLSSATARFARLLRW